jgi:hypothetical protein
MMEYDAIYLLLKTGYDDEIIDDIPKICYNNIYGKHSQTETKVGLDKLQERCDILITKYGTTPEIEILQGVINKNY